MTLTDQQIWSDTPTDKLEACARELDSLTDADKLERDVAGRLWAEINRRARTHPLPDPRMPPHVLPRGRCRRPVL